MDVGIVGGKENVGNKVVLHSGVDLDNVTSLTTDIQVVDGSTFKIIGTRTDGKGVRPVERREEGW